MNNKEQIKKLALENGFKLKEQQNGEMDLNPYVYVFAEKLLSLQSKAIVDVFSERQRQTQVEVYSTDHDDSYEQNELVRAGAGYVNHVVERGWVYNDYGAEAYQDEEVPSFWPWDEAYWKPKSPRKDLVRAAALLIAEIERIDRKGASNE